MSEYYRKIIELYQQFYEGQRWKMERCVEILSNYNINTNRISRLLYDM